MYVLSAIATFGGAIVGYDIGGSGGTFVMSAFRDTMGWGELVPGYVEPTSETNEKALITALNCVGSTIGALAAGLIADKVGRKKALLLYNAIFIIGVTIQAVTFGLAQMYIGRIIGGTGIGGLSCLSAMYSSEIPPECVRGRIVSLYQLSITIGILAASLANLAWADTVWGWRFAYGGNGIVSIVMFVACLFIPETAQWYLQQGNEEGARRTIEQTRLPDQVDSEMAKFLAAEQKRREEGNAKFAEIFDKATPTRNIRYMLMVGCMSQFLQQWTGINVLMMYAPVVFEKVFGKNASLWLTNGLNFWNMAGTIIAIIWSDKWGRRRFLLVGGILCAIGMFGSGAGYTQVDQTSPVPPSVGIGVLIFIFTLVFDLGFSAAWGPVPWTITGEIFPARFRAWGMGLATATNWICSGTLGYVAPYMMRPDAMDLWGTFFFFGFLAALAVIWVWFILPETQNVELEKMDELFTEHRQRLAGPCGLKKAVDLDEAVVDFDKDQATEFYQPPVDPALQYVTPTGTPSSYAVYHESLPSSQTHPVGQ